MRKRNFVVIGAMLLLALVLLIVGRGMLGDEPGDRVIVYLDGERYAEGRLGQKEDIVVNGPDGQVNVISFTENGFFMSHSSCDNQLCVKEGMVTTENYTRRALRTQIICLPNRVIAELQTRDDPGADLPDA